MECIYVARLFELAWVKLLDAAVSTFLGSWKLVQLLRTEARHHAA